MTDLEIALLTFLSFAALMVGFFWAMLFAIDPASLPIRQELPLHVLREQMGVPQLARAEKEARERREAERRKKVEMGDLEKQPVEYIVEMPPVFCRFVKGILGRKNEPGMDRYEK
jgi:hypothetical protein